MLISNMEVEHLRNTKEMLKRRARIMLAEEMCNAYGFLNTLYGEMAQYAMEGEIWRLENISIEDYAKSRIPEYEAICYWLNKREK